MTALLSEAGHRDGIPPAVAAWIEQALPSLDAFRAGHPVGRAAARQGYDACDQLAMVNVAWQIQNLKVHPVVGPALEEQRLDTLGLFFDIASGRVLRITESDVENLGAPND